jgi:hypothetical protein
MPRDYTLFSAEKLIFENEELKAKIVELEKLVLQLRTDKTKALLQISDLRDFLEGQQ